MAQKKVLIIEDDLLLLEYLEEYVRGFAYLVDTASCFEDAYRYLEAASDYTLIISDNQFPKFRDGSVHSDQGLEVLAYLRLMHFGVPCVLHTSDTHFETTRERFPCERVNEKYAHALYVHKPTSSIEQFLANMLASQETKTPHT